MPLTVKKLTSAVVNSTIDVKIPGQSEPEKVRIGYRPGILTSQLEEELREYGDRSEGWADLVSRLVVSWDLELEEGVPLPVEKDSLREVPGWLLQSIIVGIREDMVPSRKTAETSGGSFSPAD